LAGAGDPAGRGVTPPAGPGSGLNTEPRTPNSELPYELFLDCVHCGLCLGSCPTYVETGNENDSPRGRIYLWRAVTDGRLSLTPDVRHHLDLCLECRACETACPSGVQYGKVIGSYKRAAARQGPPAPTLNRLQRAMLFRLTPYRTRMRWALAPVRLLQHLGLGGAVRGLGRLLPRSLRAMSEIVPELAPHYGRLPEVLPAEGKRRARVALFVGCAADAFFPETTVATARVLQLNGCEVWIPRAQGCCGALHYHAGLEQPARAFAAANCAAFRRGLEEGPGAVDAVITNAGGCGPVLKEYGALLADTPAAAAGAAFGARVRDVSEFLVELGPVKPGHPLPLRATYHDACGLSHAQHIRHPPRQLLGLIPGLELVPLPESEHCCGAAGSYNLTQPEMSARLGARKADHVLTTGAEAVFTGNVGCQLQILRYLRPHRPGVWVAHPADALWASYSGMTPPRLRKTATDLHG
jgi:glycolate oxidase iron-sulfur subunit